MTHKRETDRERERRVVRAVIEVQQDASGSTF